jgi:chromosome segregation ATPase
MSEDKTKGMNDSRSFEERVFARFDAVDERFERIEGRLVNVEIKIGKLEARQYDTKPIWEQVLSAIAQLNSRLESMDARFDRIDARLDSTDSRFDRIDARLDSMDARFDRIDTRFDKLETDMDDGFRSVARKMDVLNGYLLEMRAEQRYLDRRLEKIESPPKPS